MAVIHVTDLERPELRIYSGLSEPQLYHYHEPEPGLFIAESPMIIRRALDAGYEPVSCLLEDRLLPALSGAGDPDAFPLSSMFPDSLPIYAASLEVLTRITGFALTRGILCAMRRKPCPDPASLLASSSRIVILENVMNPTNVGAIFRSAAALGMDAVLLTQGCTDPLYRRAARVSMGTVFQIPWAFMENDSSESCLLGTSGIRLLHEHGFTAAAMALTPDSISLSEFHPEPGRKIALVMGTEGPGLSDETLSACDLSIRIPMYHGVDSLNVAAASAVAFWHICSGR